VNLFVTFSIQTLNLEVPKVHKSIVPQVRVFFCVTMHHKKVMSLADKRRQGSFVQLCSCYTPSTTQAAAGMRLTSHQGDHVHAHIPLDQWLCRPSKHTALVGHAGH
jgi:hypothetical protein